MKVVTLGGSFETGKTTLYEALEKREGSRYRFVPDITKKLLEDHPCAKNEPYVLQEIYKEAIGQIVAAIKSNDGRTVICDTGLVDVAAQAQFVLETRDFVWLNRHMQDQERNQNMYIKLPLHVIPTDLCQGVQYNQHHRIDRVLRKNTEIDVQRVPAAIHAFESRYNKVLWLIQRFAASDKSEQKT